MNPWDSDSARRGAVEAVAVLASKGGARESGLTARARAMRWVGELEGEGRANRIRTCGWMELCFQPGPGLVGWRQRWCRDRACPTCAKLRANVVRAKAHDHWVARKEQGAGRMLFVTLTHPKKTAHEESPGGAVTRLAAEWRKLVNRRPVKACVSGYLRAIECVWSTSSGYGGWHAHLHIALELKPGVSIRETEARMRAAWVDILTRKIPALELCKKCDGEPRPFKDRCLACDGVGTERARVTKQAAAAQDFQELDEKKIGQIVKYITKPFELPDNLAPTFFDEMKGRRLLEGGGTWRGFATDDDTGDDLSVVWVPQAAHCAELAQKAGERPESPWIFRWLRTEAGVKAICPWHPPREGETACSEALTAAEAWRRLIADPRPAHKRVASLDPLETPAAPNRKSGHDAREQKR